MNTDAERPVTLGDWLDLREQMSAAELLLEDEQIDPANLSAYWAISAELLAMIEATDERLEDWREHGPGADEAERLLAMRRRLVNVLAKAEEIGIEGV